MHLFCFVLFFSFVPSSASHVEPRGQALLSHDEPLPVLEVQKNGTDVRGSSDPQCAIFQEKIDSTWRRVDEKVGLDICEGVCAPQIADAKAHGQISSYRCEPIQPVQWSDVFPNVRQAAPGNCSCNDAALVLLGDITFNEIVPAINEISCKAWWTAITGVVEVGLNFIPGAGGAVAAAAQVILQATEMIVYSLPEKAQQIDMHRKLLANGNDTSLPQSLADRICGNDFPSAEGEKFFNAFSQAASLVAPAALFRGAVKFPPPWSKGEGHPDELWKTITNLKGDAKKPDPKPEPKPNDLEHNSHPQSKQDPPSENGKTPEQETKPRHASDGKDPPKSDPKEASSVKTDPKSGPEASGRPTQESGGLSTKSDSNDEDDQDCGRANLKRAGPVKTGGQGSPKHSCKSKSTKSSSTKSSTKPTAVTSYLVARSVEQLKTIKMKCPSELYHACAHYFSAIRYGSVKGPMTCSDSQNHRARRSKERGLEAVKSWKSEHTNAVWKEYTQSFYSFAGDASVRVRCEADEWPPVYFIPDQQTDRRPGEWRQLVRWIPSHHNGGAGRIWRGFCAEYDGGAGNGQRLGSSKAVAEQSNRMPFNTRGNGRGGDPLVKLEGIVQVKTVTNRGTPTTISEWPIATFTRAIMEWDWDFPRGEPSPQNDFYLTENPCWPSAIVPNDPGFALQTGDPWYSNKADRLRFPDAQDWADEYKKAPPASLLSLASQAVASTQPGALLAGPVSKQPKLPPRAKRFEDFWEMLQRRSEALEEGDWNLDGDIDDDLVEAALQVGLANAVPDRPSLNDAEPTASSSTYVAEPLTGRPALSANLARVTAK